uniref:Uncharacterized protein n=1 Tax=Caenorhabditis japonica TaxID=281687 RepID=A0A8R1E679_CAEJA
MAGIVANSHGKRQIAIENGMTHGPIRWLLAQNFLMMFFLHLSSFSLDQLVEFALPGLEERERILLQYFNEHIVVPATSGSRSQRLKLDNFDFVAKCSEIAKKTTGMSGRELSKLVIGWQASAYASETGVLTEAIVDRNTADAMLQHEHKMEWLEKEQRKARHQEVKFGTTLKRETAV